MTLTVQIDLSAQDEKKLQVGISRHDKESVHRVLSDALGPTVEALLQRKPARRSVEDYEAMAERLVDEFEALTAGQAPVLSDEALSRAGIYEGHP
ncbi:MAG: hypothetical protein V3T83_02265 [Acidobacteriota bacterium]